MPTASCAACGARLTPWDAKCPSCGEAVSAADVSSGEGEAREAVRARLAEAARAEYEIVGELGRGGMGWVFLGRDRKLGRLAALKVLPSLDALRPASVERFRREAETAARLSHSNIVPVYGAGGDMATPYFAMAYIEGESLAERITKAGALPVAEALRIGREVGSALAYAHRQGVVHRDVKPQNVMLERDSGRALVTDFGIARAGAAERMTMSGVAIGTPGYMAPEQAAGASDVDARADVYAMGVVLFEMLTGKRLESFETGEWPISSASVRRAAQRTRPDLSAGLVEVVARATAPRREDRWPSVDALLAALEPFAPGARPRARWRTRVWWYAAGTAIVVAAAFRLGLLSLFHVVLRPMPVGGAAPRKIAIMRFVGDTAETNSLLRGLQFQLGGVSTVRVADGRVFAPPAGSDPRSEDVRAAARKAGASWILHGYVEPTPTGRALLVRLVSVDSGLVTNVGRTTVPAMSIAAADSVVLLLSRGSVARELGLAAGTGAAPAAPDAARAFDAAENAFRRADYAGAVREYDNVIALDTGFALARYKRFLAALQQEPTEDRIREAVDAVRGFVPRMGALEGRLLAAYLVLFDSGNVAEAEARLRRLVVEDSTFLDGWFALGEVRYHFGALAGLPPDSAVAAFDHALALWPDAAPALMHLVGLDLWLGREPEAKDHIRRYLAQDSTSPIGRTMKLGRTVLFGSLKERSAVLGRLGTLDDQILEFSALTGAQTARHRADLVNAQQALVEMTRARRSARVRSEGARFLIASYLAQGRWSDAARELDGLRAALPGDAELVRWPAIAYLVGYGSRDAALRAAGGRLSATSRATPGVDLAVDLWLNGVVQLAAGDTTQARQTAAALEPAVAGRPTLRGLRDALAGGLAEARGDTTRAIADYTAALTSLDAARAPFALLSSEWLPRYRLAQLRLASADTAGALALLEAQDFVAAFADQVLRGPAWLLRARILAARHDVEGATRYLRRTVNLLHYAEPPWDLVRDSARAELARLGARP